jgi:hypothetical protein
MPGRLDHAGYDWPENADDSLSPKQRVYSLEVIIALQKALEGGIQEGAPEEMLSSRQADVPKERRRLSERRRAPSPSMQKINPGPFARILRRVLIVITRAARAPVDGRFARNTW